MPQKFTVKKPLKKEQTNNFLGYKKLLLSREGTVSFKKDSEFKPFSMQFSEKYPIIIIFKSRIDKKNTLQF